MAQSFNITAWLQLKVGNVRPAVASLQQQLGSVSATINAGVSPASVRSTAAATNAIQGLQTGLAGAASAAANFNNQFKTSGLSNSVRQINLFHQNMRNAKQATYQAGLSVRDATSEMVKFGQQTALAARRYLAFGLGALTFVRLASSIRDAAGEALEFQHNMVKLSQLGAVSGREIQETSDTISQLGRNLGVSSKELSNVSIYLKGAGLNIGEVKDALEVLAKTSLAPTFKDIRSTTEGLLSLRQQFSLSSKDFSSAFGAINAVAKDFAVESEDVVEAVKRAGAAFRAASGDLESPRDSLNKFIALFTSVRATTRESAESISTSLRTVFGRLQDNKVVQNLKDMGINVRYTSEEASAMGENVQGQFVGIWKAVGRVSEALKGVPTTDARFAAVMQQLGGSRNLSRVIPLIQQYATAQKALASAQAGTNSLTRDADKSQEAFTQRIAKLREEFLGLVREVSQSKWFGALVDGFITAAKAATQLIRSLTPLMPLIASMAAFKLGTSAFGFAKGLATPPPVFGTRRFAHGGIVAGHGDSDSVSMLAPEGAFFIRKPVAKRLDGETVHKLVTGTPNKRQGKKMVPVRAMPGEIMVPPELVPYHGEGFLRRLNAGHFTSKRHATGGKVSRSAILDLAGLEPHPKVSYSQFSDSPGLIKKLFGISSRHVLNAAGVLPQSVVELSLHKDRDLIDVAFQRRGTNSTRNLRVKDGKVASVYNESFFSGEQSQGDATQSYARQVLLGKTGPIKFKAIGSHATQPFQSGYYVWPAKFGAEGKLPEGFMKGLAASHPNHPALTSGAATVQDVIGMHGGEDLWHKFGSEFDATVDPQNDKVLKAIHKRILSAKIAGKFASGGVVKGGVRTHAAIGALKGYSNLFNANPFTNFQKKHFAGGGIALDPREILAEKLKKEAGKQGISLVDLMTAGRGLPGKKVMTGWDWLDEEPKQNFFGGLVRSREQKKQDLLRRSLASQFGDDVDFTRFATLKNRGVSRNRAGQFMPYGKTGPEVQIPQSQMADWVVGHEFAHAGDYVAGMHKKYINRRDRSLPYASAIPGHPFHEVAKAAIKPIYSKISNPEFYRQEAASEGIDEKKLHHVEAFASAMQAYGERRQYLQAGYKEHELPTHLSSLASRQVFGMIDTMVLPHLAQASNSLARRRTPVVDKNAPKGPSLLGRVFARLIGHKNTVASSRRDATGLPVTNIQKPRPPGLDPNKPVRRPGLSVTPPPPLRDKPLLQLTHQPLSPPTSMLEQAQALTMRPQVTPDVAAQAQRTGRPNPTAISDVPIPLPGPTVSQVAASVKTGGLRRSSQRGQSEKKKAEVGFVQGVTKYDELKDVIPETATAGPEETVVKPEVSTRKKGEYNLHDVTPVPHLPDAPEEDIKLYNFLKARSRAAGIKDALFHNALAGEKDKDEEGKEVGLRRLAPRNAIPIHEAHIREKILYPEGAKDYRKGMVGLGVEGDEGKQHDVAEHESYFGSKGQSFLDAADLRERVVKGGTTVRADVGDDDVEGSLHQRRMDVAAREKEAGRHNPKHVAKALARAGLATKEDVAGAKSLKEAFGEGEGARIVNTPKVIPPLVDKYLKETSNYRHPKTGEPYYQRRQATEKIYSPAENAIRSGEYSLEDMKLGREGHARRAEIVGSVLGEHGYEMRDPHYVEHLGRYVATVKKRENAMSPVVNANVPVRSQVLSAKRRAADVFARRNRGIGAAGVRAAMTPQSQVAPEVQPVGPTSSVVNTNGLQQVPIRSQVITAKRRAADVFARRNRGIGAAGVRAAMARQSQVAPDVVDPLTAKLHEAAKTGAAVHIPQQGHYQGAIAEHKKRAEELGYEHEVTQKRGENFYRMSVRPKQTEEELFAAYQKAGGTAYQSIGDVEKRLQTQGPTAGVYSLNSRRQAGSDVGVTPEKEALFKRVGERLGIKVRAKGGGKGLTRTHAHFDPEDVAAYADQFKPATGGGDEVAPTTSSEERKSRKRSPRKSGTPRTQTAGGNSGGPDDCCHALLDVLNKILTAIKGIKIPVVRARSDINPLPGKGAATAHVTPEVKVPSVTPVDRTDPNHPFNLKGGKSPNLNIPLSERLAAHKAKKNTDFLASLGENFEPSPSVPTPSILDRPETVVPPRPASKLRPDMPHAPVDTHLIDVIAEGLRRNEPLPPEVARPELEGIPHDLINVGPKPEEPGIKRPSFERVPTVIPERQPTALPEREPTIVAERKPTVVPVRPETSVPSRVPLPPPATNEEFANRLYEEAVKNYQQPKGATFKDVPSGVLDRVSEGPSPFRKKVSHLTRKFLDIKRSPVADYFKGISPPGEMVSPLSPEEEFELQLAGLHGADAGKVEATRNQLIESRGGMQKKPALGKFGAGLGKFGKVGLGVGAVAAQFVPTVLEHTYGTFEQPGIGGVEGVKRVRQVGGAVSGAATGAFVGSAAGPVGTVIGGAIGALHGFITATKEADKELRELKIGRAFKQLDSAMESVISGKTKPTAGVISDVNQQLGEFDKAESEQSVRTDYGALAGRAALALNPLGAAHELSYQLGYSKTNLNQAGAEALTGRQGFIRRNFNWMTGGEDLNVQDSKTRLADRKKYVQEHIEPRLGQFRAFNEAIAGDVKIANPELLRSTDESGRPLSEERLNQNRQARIAEFERRGGRETAARVVEATPGMTFEKYYKEIDKIILEANKEQTAHKALTQAINQQEIETSKLLRIGHAIDATVAAMGNLQHGVDALDAAFEGQVRAVPVKSHVAAAENFGGLDNEAYNKAVQFVTNGISGGPNQSQLAQQFGHTAIGVNQAASVLPDIINRAGAGGTVSGEGIISNIDTGLKAQNIPEDIRKRINDMLTGMKPEEVGKLAGENVQKLADQLIKEGFANVNETLTKAAKALEDRANNFNQGLARNQEMINKVGESQNKYANLQVKAAQSRARVQAEVVGRPGQADLSVETQMAPFQMRQERLTGISGAGANNPQLIGQRLRATHAAIAQVTQTRDEATDPHTQDAASESLAQLQGNAQRLGQALEHLADPVERNAVLQEKLNRQEENRNSKLSFTEKLATADPRQLMQMQRNAMSSDVAVRQGHLLGLTTEQRQGALEHLSSLGEAEVPGYGGRKASDVRKQVLLGTALHTGIISQGEEKQRLGTMQQMAGNDQTAVQAQAEIVNNQKSLQGEFFSKLEGLQSQFFARLSVTMAEANVKDVTAQTGEAQGKFNKANKAAQAAQVFTSLGVSADQARQLKNENVSGVGDLLKTQKNIEGLHGAVAQTIQSGTGEFGNEETLKNPTKLADAVARNVGTSQEDVFQNVLPTLNERLQKSGNANDPATIRAHLADVVKGKYAADRSEQISSQVSSRVAQISQNTGVSPKLVGKFATQGREFNNRVDALGDQSTPAIAENLLQTGAKLRSLKETTTTAVAEHENAKKALVAAQKPPVAPVVGAPPGIPTPTAEADLSAPVRVDMNKVAIRPAPPVSRSQLEKAMPFQQADERGREFPPGAAPAAFTAHQMTGTPLPDVFAPVPSRRMTTKQRLAGINADKKAISLVDPTAGGDPATQDQVQQAVLARANQLQRSGLGKKAAYLRQQAMTGKGTADLARTDAASIHVPKPTLPPALADDASQEEVQQHAQQRADYFRATGRPKTANNILRKAGVAGGNMMQPTGGAPQTPLDPAQAMGQNLQSLGGVAGTLDKTVGNLSSALSNAAGVFKDMKIPDKIVLEFSGNHDVVINGAQLVAAIKGDVAKMVGEEIVSQLSEKMLGQVKDMPA